MYENGRLGSDIVETTDEDGQVHIFEKIDEYELDGKRYALLIYQGGEEDEEKEESAEEGYEEEVVVMRVVHEPDGDVFEAIEDEAEFERVVKYIEEAGAEDDDELGGLGFLRDLE
jgi:hypothetical protein